MNTFETERLTLRLFSLDDAAFLLALYNSESFIQFIGDKNIRSEEQARDYIKTKFIPQAERLGYGNYIIILKENNIKIGSIGIFEREGLEVNDIGYSLLKEYEANGYAYEAASKLKEIAFCKFGIKKLSAITTAENLPSQKLIKKLGLTYAKTIKLPDDPEELLYFEN